MKIVVIGAGRIVSIFITRNPDKLRQDKASGEIRDYTGAMGGDRLTDAFRILCPKASANIASGWS